MYVTDTSEVVIRAEPGNIWNYVSDPEHWTESNPEEHYGLEYDTPDNRPAQGATFHQREKVAGVMADLHGRFAFVDKPRVAVWVGTAYYRLLFGLIVVPIPEGGTLRLESDDGETRISHSVWMDFPKTLSGRLVRWGFLNLFDGKSKLHDHVKKELVYFKKKLEMGEDAQNQYERNDR